MTIQGSERQESEKSILKIIVLFYFWSWFQFKTNVRDFLNFSYGTLTYEAKQAFSFRQCTQPVIKV